MNGVLNETLLVGLLAAFAAGTVSGLAGFGFALAGVPLLLLVYDPATVVAITAISSAFSNAAMVWDARRDIQRRAVAALVPFACLGMLAGSEVLMVMDANYIQLIAGIVVVVSALLLSRSVPLPGTRSRWGVVAAGSTSGLLATSTGLAGPPVVLLLTARGYPKYEFRGTMATYFLAIGLVSIGVLHFRGLVGPGQLSLAALLVPAALLGKLVGTAFLKRVSEHTFRRITLVIVILTGVAGTATAALALL